MCPWVGLIKSHIVVVCGIVLGNAAIVLRRGCGRLGYFFSRVKRDCG